MQKIKKYVVVKIHQKYSNLIENVLFYHKKVLKFNYFCHKYL